MERKCSQRRPLQGGDIWAQPQWSERHSHFERAVSGLDRKKNSAGTGAWGWVLSWPLMSACLHIPNPFLFLCQWDSASSALVRIWNSQYWLWFSQTLFRSDPSPGFLPHPEWKLPKPGLLLPLRSILPGQVHFFFLFSFKVSAFAFILPSSWNTFLLKIVLTYFLLSFRPSLKLHFLQEFFPKTL